MGRRYWLFIASLFVLVCLLAASPSQAGWFKCDGCGERNKNCVCDRRAEHSSNGPVTPPPATMEPATTCSNCASGDSCELPIAKVLDALREEEPREEPKPNPFAPSLYGGQQQPQSPAYGQPPQGYQQPPYQPQPYGSVQFPGGGVRVDPHGVQVQTPRGSVQVQPQYTPLGGGARSLARTPGPPAGGGDQPRRQPATLPGAGWSVEYSRPGIELKADSLRVVVIHGEEVLRLDLSEDVEPPKPKRKPKK